MRAILDHPVSTDLACDAQRLYMCDRELYFYILLRDQVLRVRAKTRKTETASLSGQRDMQIC